MASFHNPYQKGPDVGQGLQGIFQQIMQAMMMKKMMGGGGADKGPIGMDTVQPPPMNTGVMGTPGQFPPSPSPSPAMPGQPPASGMGGALGGMSPDQIQQILRMVQSLGLGQGMGGGMGRL